MTARFQCISEAEKFDELFVADEQVYEHKKVTIVKTKKSKHEFDIDNLNVGDEKAPGTAAGGSSKPGQSVEKKPDGDAGKGQEKDESQSPGKELIRERSVEMLSMSDDEDSPPKKKNNEKQVPYVDTRNEKPADVFRNMYSDFKEFIPGKKNNEQEPAGKKQGFMSKARGFFGL